MPNALQIEISAETKSLFEGVSKARGAVTEFSAHSKAAFEGVGQAVAGLQTGLLKLAALLGGGALLKGTVDETVAWTVQAQKLSRVLGTTTEASSVLALAIEHIHGNVDDFLSGSAKLTRTLNKNEDAIRRLGVETRDANGHFKAAPQLISEINARLGQYKEGLDRDLEAQKVYGKSYQEMLRFVRLTPEVMEEARAKAERLHLLVGPEGAAKVEAYRGSLHDVDDTYRALKVRIGGEILPALTELAAWFSGVGPDLIQGAVTGVRFLGEALSTTTVQAVALSLAARAYLLPALAQGYQSVMAFATLIQGRMAAGLYLGLTRTEAFTGAVLQSINPLVLLTAVVVAAGLGLDCWATATRRAADEHLRLVQGSLEGATRFRMLGEEATRLDQVTRSSTASTEQKQQATARLALIVDQLKAAYPGFNRFLTDEAGHQRSIAEALKLANAERATSIKLQIQETEAKLAAAQIDLSADKGLQDANWFTRHSGFIAEKVKASKEAVEKYREAIAALRQELTGAGPLPDLRSEGGHDSETALQKLKADLEKRKYLYEKEAYDRGQLMEFTKAQEAQWLEENAAHYGLNAKEKAEADRLLFEARRAVMKEAFDGEVEALKASLETYKHDAQKRLDIAEDVYLKVAMKHGLESKAAAEAYKEVLKIRQEVADQELKVEEAKQEALKHHRLAEVELDKAFLERRRALGEISEVQLLEGVRALEARRYEIEKGALEARLRLANLEPPEREKIQAELEALADKHRLEMQKTRFQLDTELQKTDSWAGWQKGIQEALEQGANAFEHFRQAATSVTQGVTQAFATSAQGMLTGQMNLGQGLRAIWKGTVSAIIGALTQLGAQYLVTAATQKVFGAQAAATTAASAAVEAQASLTAGAAGAWEAYGWIPYVGAGLALAQIAEMEASVAAVHAAPIVAHAVGGLIDRPTLALMGEAGREVVAPEQDFRDWAKGLVNLGANLQANLGRAVLDAQAYQAAGQGYAAAANRAGRASLEAGGTFSSGLTHNDFRGALFLGTSEEARRQFDRAVRQSQDRWARGNA